MGNPNSKGQDGAKVVQYEPKIEVLRIVDDPNYGRVKLVRDIDTQSQMIMKEYVYDTKQAYEKETKFLANRVAFNHENIVRIIGFNSKASQKYCSTFYKSSVFIEVMTKDLDTELKERTRRKSPYTEGELLTIAENAIAAGSFLQSNNIAHGDIRPLNIFIYSQSYIFTDPNLEVDKNANALIKAIIKKDRTLLSPQLLSLVPQGKFEHECNIYKADVFSLGATLLNAATLNNSEDLYDYQTGTINQELLNERLEIIRAHYSDFTYNMIKDMLQIEEINRPDFAELEQRISPYREAIRDREDMTRVFKNVIYERHFVQETQGEARGETQKKAAALPSNRSQNQPRNRLQSNQLESDEDEDPIIATERTQQKTDRHNASVISHPAEDRKGEFFSPEELELQIKKAIERSQNTYKIVKDLELYEESLKQQNAPSHNSNTYVVPVENRHFDRVSFGTHEQNLSRPEVEVTKKSVPETNVEQTQQPKSDYSDLVQEIMKKYQTPSAGAQDYTTTTYQPATYNVETSYKPVYTHETEVRQASVPDSYSLKKSYGVESQLRTEGNDNISAEVKRIMETYGGPSQTTYTYTTTTNAYPAANVTNELKNSQTNQRPYSSDITGLQSYQPYVPQTTTDTYQVSSNYNYEPRGVEQILADLKKSQGNQNALKSSYTGAGATDTYKPSYEYTYTTEKVTQGGSYGLNDNAGLKSSQTGANTYTVKPIETYTYTTTYNAGSQPGAVLAEVPSAYSTYTPTTTY